MLIGLRRESKTADFLGRTDAIDLSIGLLKVLHHIVVDNTLSLSAIALTLVPFGYKLNCCSYSLFYYSIVKNLLAFAQ